MQTESRIHTALCLRMAAYDQRVLAGTEATGLRMGEDSSLRSELHGALRMKCCGDKAEAERSRPLPTCFSYLRGTVKTAPYCLAEAVWIMARLACGVRGDGGGGCGVLRMTRHGQDAKKA